MILTGSNANSASQNASSNADKRRLRDALGTFTTGVTVVTSLDEAGAPVGITASSFNSVSLDPPLVLWSLSRASASHDAFAASGHFAIHVLRAGQQELSGHFARASADKFADVAWEKGALGSPLLDGCAARFQCRTHAQYDGGDHVIMVGEVVHFEAQGGAPLLFHGGSYGELKPRPSAPADAATASSIELSK